MTFRRVLLLLFLGIMAVMLASPGCDNLVTEVRNNMVIDSTLGEACVICHNDQDNRFLRPKSQWANSRHASDSLLDRISVINGADFTVNVCAPQCHTHEGFVQTFDSVFFEAKTYNVIGCFTCHQPHTGAYGTWNDTTLRALYGFVLLTNDSAYNMGLSNMCVNCHQAAGAAPPVGVTADVKLTAEFGPHFSGQADVLSGKGGYRWTSAAVPNSHQLVANINGCLKCHYGTGQGYSFGEHTFRLQTIRGPDTTQYLANCVDCHVDLVNFYTFEGPSSNYNRIDSIARLADSLEILLKSRAYLDPSDPAGIKFLADSTVPVNAARILYNYLLYRFDGSYGVHNPNFLERLLTESIVRFDSLPPAAEFLASVTSGCAPLTVDFTDQSKGVVTSRNWTFGDGKGPSTVANPTHTYDTAGTYTVSLTVSSGTGADTVTRQAYIKAFATQALFTGSPLAACSSAVVQFLDASPGAVTSWDWDFGDGGTSVERNPAHDYQTFGAFDVRLIVTDSCGTDTLIKPAYVLIASGPPVADFVGTPLTGAASLEVRFTDLSTGGVTAWDWNFGDGTANSTQQNPQHIYSTAGQYTVTLTVINTCGQNTKIKADYIVVQ